MDILSIFLQIALLLSFYHYFKKSRPKVEKTCETRAAGPPGAQPFIGHLHLLGSKVPVAKTLAAMSDKYGPIFSIRLGSHQGLVVSNWEAIKECFTANDRVFATHGPNMTISQVHRLQPGKLCIGSLWILLADLRKIATVELFTSRQLDNLSHVRAFIRDLYPLFSNFRRAQGEIKTNVGQVKWVQESDIKNLDLRTSHLQRNTKVVAGPDVADQDCYVVYYYIPKDTRLIMNLWKLHRDPNMWSNPDEFRPERFLNESSYVNFRGQCFEYIPFSSGRRMCPEMTFGLLVIHLTLARLLQGFHVSTPMVEAVDMGEGLSTIALPKLKPLEVVLTPRLPREL